MLREKLVHLLLTDEQGASNLDADSALLKSFIERKIEKDFQNNNTLVVHGWVLAVSEARQCALFSLLQP